MRHTFILVITTLLLSTAAYAQERLIDATDHSPISAASILDASGNMVGFTLSDGEFTEIPESAYPITIRCLGYEPLIIERPQNKAWEMTPKEYELEEVVIVPAERNILKQTLYIREHFSVTSKTDTLTEFTEHMAARFVPATKDSKFSGSTSVKLLGGRCIRRYKVAERDSIKVVKKPTSMISILELSDDPVKTPESFKNQDTPTKLYEVAGKSGKSLIQRQNANTFTTIEDLLAEKKGHSTSPWPFKLLGFTMDINQLYETHVYRVNDEGMYLPKDMIEASFVIEAVGKGKYLRLALQSDKPVMVRMTIEMYVVDHDYLTKEEYKKEKKFKPENVDFVIPSTVPSLDKATERLLQRAIDEKKLKK